MSWDKLFKDSPNTVSVNHENQTFEIGGIKLDRQQVLALNVAFTSYYKDHEFIDSKGNAMDIGNYLKQLNTMK